MTAAYRDEPYRPLDAEQARHEAVGEALEAARRYRALDAARRPWSGSDSRRLLRTLAEREGKVYVEPGTGRRPAAPPKPKAERTCQVCHRTFEARPPYVAKTCSKPCRLAHQAAAARARAAARKKAAAAG